MICQPIMPQLISPYHHVRSAHPPPPPSPCCNEEPHPGSRLPAHEVPRADDSQPIRVDTHDTLARHSNGKDGQPEQKTRSKYIISVVSVEIPGIDDHQTIPPNPSSHSRDSILSRNPVPSPPRRIPPSTYPSLPRPNTRQPPGQQLVDTRPPQAEAQRKNSSNQSKRAEKQPVS